MADTARAALATTPREQRIVAFLARHGWGGASRRMLAGDASFRHYERLTQRDRRAVLMDAPPPQEDVRPYVRIARLLRSLGLSAPEILAADEAAGLLLIEDFGDDTYTRVLARGGAEEPLYALAIDALIALQKRFDAASPHGLLAFEEERALEEAERLLDWYWPAMLGGPAPDAVRAEFLAAWRIVLPRRRAVADTIALFDYHVDNLMLLPGRAGVAACGLLDFQDAMLAPQAFDLVSLLEDVRRDTPPALVAAMRQRYLTAFPALDREAFDIAYAVLGAQRNTRIAGQFVRLCVRDGKPGYLAFLPRVWRLLEGDLSHPALAPVRAWFDVHLPAGRRGVPPLVARGA